MPGRKQTPKPFNPQQPQCRVNLDENHNNIDINSVNNLARDNGLCHRSSHVYHNNDLHEAERNRFRRIFFRSRSTHSSRFVPVPRRGRQQSVPSSEGYRRVERLRPSRGWYPKYAMEPGKDYIPKVTIEEVQADETEQSKELLQTVTVSDEIRSKAEEKAASIQP